MNENSNKDSASTSTKAGSEQEIHSAIEVASFCKEHNLNAEMVGRWVWVTFAQKPDTSLRRLLKKYGFRWSGRRGCERRIPCGRQSGSCHGCR